MGLKDKRILITCGPTWVPVDDMRIISNRSTGEMGHLLALACEKAQAKVTVIQGPINRSLKSNKSKVIEFFYFDEFVKIFNKELKAKYDVIIHAAALSDYKLKKPFTAKIKSAKKDLQLHLVPTEKIINRIKRIAPKSFLVGFKLESQTTKKSAITNSSKLFKEAGCNLVIANSSTATKYKGFILNKDNGILGSAINKNEIIRKLVSIIQKELI